MPTYYKGGYEPRNVRKLTNKGYFVKREGTIIHRRFGAVDLTGHSLKSLRWSKGYPQFKSDNFKTIEEAKEFMRVKILRRINHGYNKIPQQIK